MIERGFVRGDTIPDISPPAAAHDKSTTSPLHIKMFSLFYRGDVSPRVHCHRAHRIVTAGAKLPTFRTASTLQFREREREREIERKKERKEEKIQRTMNVFQALQASALTC